MVESDRDRPEGFPRRVGGPPLRLRALGVGLLALLPNCYWITLSETFWYQDFPTCLSLFVNAIFTLLVVLALNGLCARLAPRLALNRLEVLAVYAMTCMASSLASLDMIPWIFAVASAPFRLHPTNCQWDPLLLPLLPRWWVVTDLAVLQPFYNGHTRFYRAEFLAAWAGPLAAWFLFVLLLLTVMFCLTSVFSRRWIQHDKLAFPILEIPLALAGEPTRPERRMFTHPAFLIGAGLAVGLDVLNGLAFLYPAVPSIPVKWYNINVLLPPPYNQTWFPGSLFPFCIGLSYFLPSDMAFSTWFFFLLRKGEEMLCLRLGTYEAGMDGFPSPHLQSCGALLGLAVLAVWRAGPHFRALFRKAWQPSEADSEDPLSARTTLLWGGGALLALMVLVRAMGLEVWMVPVYLGIYYLFLLAITRLRVELGPVSHEFYQAGPNRTLLAVLGSRSLSRETAAAFTLMRFMNAIHRSSPMVQQMEALKMAQVTGASGRRMVLPLALAGGVGLGFVFWAILHLSYRIGNFGVGERDWFFDTGNWLYSEMHDWIVNPREAQPRNIAQLFLPLGVVLGLAGLRTRWLGCPFHPAGLALGLSAGPEYYWLPLLVAWAVKGLILRYGGRRAYRQWAPFFVGLVLGEYLMGAFWGLYQLLTHRTTYSFWLG